MSFSFMEKYMSETYLKQRVKEEWDESLYWECENTVWLCNYISHQGDHEVVK